MTGIFEPRVVENGLTTGINDLSIVIFELMTGINELTTGIFELSIVVFELLIVVKSSVNVLKLGFCVDFEDLKISTSWRMGQYGRTLYRIANPLRIDEYTK